MSEKVMAVFAGPNGSGKSTIVKNTLELGCCPREFICPDNLVVAHEKENPEAYKKAMQEAEAIRNALLAQGKSFSFETVLSTREKLDFIRKAKWLGYKVHVVYVTTDDPQINIERVKSRVTQGGHNVPVDKILSRYEKCMNLMYDVMRAADTAMFYDNSGCEPRWVAWKPDRENRDEDLPLLLIGNQPNWLKTYVIEKMPTAPK
ncbi:MAG: zeta toxin family protein [Oscillospiraceae bacterium]|nr:zeta toxin family protein [Oscillospiraceae bacterium]